MQLLVPDIFKQFPQVVAAMSLRDHNVPAEFNMSLFHGNKEETKQNRSDFAQELGFPPDRLVTIKQVHSDNVVCAEENPKYKTEGDGLVSNQTNQLLGITVADCVPILLFDPSTNSYGAIHSGWRGSSQDIAGKAVALLTQKFHVNPSNLYAWIGPSAGSQSYEVGYDVVEQFNPKYSKPISEDKWLFDNKSVVCDQLKNAGLSEGQIEISTLDTITNPSLHSDRRDGEKSGRMCAAIGVIG